MFMVYASLRANVAQKVKDVVLNDQLSEHNKRRAHTRLVSEGSYWSVLRQRDRESKCQNRAKDNITDKK